MTHNEAINAVLLHLSRLRCFAARREVGLFYDARGTPRHVGIKGEADVQGTTPAGKSIAVEVKTRGGCLDKPQRAWRDAFVALGGLYMVARPDTDPEWRMKLVRLVSGEVVE